MSESLEDRIIRHEGFCEFPKPDAKGFYVIGHGHDISKADCDNFKNGISTEEAYKFLEQDINTAKLSVARELPWSLGLSDIRQEVLQEMCFQLGINGLLGFHKMLDCARDGDNEGASANMLDSIWHKQTPSRCEELAALWLNNGEENV